MERNSRFNSLSHELMTLLQELDRIEVDPSPIREAVRKLEDLLFDASFPHTYLAGDLYLSKKQKASLRQDAPT